MNYSKKFLPHFSNILTVVALVLFACLSLSRSAALVAGYHAPLDIYTLIPNAPLNSNINICVGKEWYRFPNSFFLPVNVSLNFIQSEFRGQLPAPFSTIFTTRFPPPYFNDMNLEDPSRYLSIDKCDYLVDLTGGDISNLEPRYDTMPQWQPLACLPFLDPSRTKLLDRVLYLPFYRFRVAFYQYCLLKSTR